MSSTGILCPRMCYAMPGTHVRYLDPYVLCDVRYSRPGILLSGAQHMLIDVKKDAAGGMVVIAVTVRAKTEQFACQNRIRVCQN
eukprot:3210214-Rhodomonas_salina.2